MVREIIHLQVGQCGNQIGTRFWGQLCEEHNIDASGKWKGAEQKEEDYVEKTNMDLGKINVYMQETSERWVPRAVLVDSEPGTLDAIKAGALGDLFRPGNFFNGASGTSNNWAKGHYTDGAELAQKVWDVIRKEAEKCDSPQGFQMAHSLGGGTGSGMGTLLLNQLAESYPDRIFATFSVYPSPKVSDTVVEPYNTILAHNHLLENADETFVVDNEALFHIAKNILKLKAPTFADLNHLIAYVMSGVSASLRFPGVLNADLRKIGVNLIPFPRLHFFQIAQAPLFSKANKKYVKVTVRELIVQSFSGSQVLANVNPKEGKLLASAFIFRGSMASQEVDDEVEKIQNENRDGFVEWIPNNFKTAIVKRGPKYAPNAAVNIGNTTAMKGVFERISKQFSKLFDRRAYLHWYRQEGMDEQEFRDANDNCKDLIVEYQDKEEAEMDLSNPDLDAKMDDYVSRVGNIRKVWDGYEAGGNWAGEWQEEE